MKFIVVIDRHSLLGRTYQQLCPPIAMGPESHVGLPCTEMDASNPHYMFVRTQPTTQGLSRQALHLPHGNVLLVIQYDDQEKLPPSFG